MKSRLWVLALCLGILLSCRPAFAEEGQKGEDFHGGKHKMMGMMHNDSLVATSDGGVAVLQGPRLLKYDASLTLVKEVELPKGKKPEHPEGQAPQDENQDSGAPE